VGGKDGHLGGGQGNKAIKLALSGCHDTTLAAVLASLGAFQGESWPPFTSHIALELFRKGNEEKIEVGIFQLSFSPFTGAERIHVSNTYTSLVAQNV
jgi:hypothetical protein